MITAFRSYLSTWVVRGFFLLLVLAFAMWGIGDVLRNMGRGDTWVAKVGDVTIEPPQAEEAFRRALAQVTRGGRVEATPEIRRAVATQSLDRLIAQTLLAEEARRLHVVVPTDALRQTIYALPALQGPNGQFDRSRFEQLLRNNGLNEPRFLELMRADLAQRQIVEALRAGATPPAPLVRTIFAAQNEKRSAEIAELPFAAAKPPPPPGEDVLRRWWENHPDLYRTPEYRRVKAVVLSPQTLAKDIAVTDADLQAAYDAHKSDYVTPEKRSAEVLSLQDEAKAKTLAAEWRSGADWAKVQQDAKEAGGVAVELADATQAEFPSPELGRAVFAAPPDQVVGPVQGPFGWNVLRVTKVTPGSERSFDQVKDELRNRVLADKATDLMYERANKLDNILAGGTGLDELPADLGLAGVTGTLDAQGNTQSGEPAPIPGPPELRAAIAQAAFQAQKGDPPRLAEVQTPSTGGSAYYALQVEDVTPAAVKPFETVRDQVAQDWMRDAVRREQEAAAARMLTAVKAGASLADAAREAGVAVRTTPLTGRDTPAPGFPPALLGPLFSLKKGEPTMVETPDGFVVAVPARIEIPDPASDKAGYDRIEQALAQSLGNDIEVSFVRGLRERAGVKVNQKLLDQIAQP
jgi:peptidyl-prolyl cis-trans isomerase D